MSTTDYLSTLLVAAHKIEHSSNDDSSTLHVLATDRIGEPLAAWLRESADHLANHLPSWQHRWPEGWEGDTPLPANRPRRTDEELARIVEHHYGKALATARAILGEAS